MHNYSYNELSANPDFKYFYKSTVPWPHLFYNVKTDTLILIRDDKKTLYNDYSGIEEMCFYAGNRIIETCPRQFKLHVNQVYENEFLECCKLYLEETMGVAIEVSDKYLIFQNQEDADFFKMKYAQLFCKAYK